VIILSVVPGDALSGPEGETPPPTELVDPTAEGRRRVLVEGRRRQPLLL